MISVSLSFIYIHCSDVERAICLSHAMGFVIKARKL